MARVIKVEFIGIIVVLLDIPAYGAFLRSIVTDTERIITNMPEFQAKRKKIKVTLIPQKNKKELIEDGEDIIEKVIEIPFRDLIEPAQEDPGKIKQILIDAAVSAVQKELPNIEASPFEPEPEAKIETGIKKPWWKIWSY